MTTIPKLDDKTSQIHQWAQEFLRLLGRDTTRQAVNQTVITLRDHLADVSDHGEMELMAQAFETANACQEWREQLLNITTLDSHYRELRRRKLLHWRACIRLEAKRKGW